MQLLLSAPVPGVTGRERDLHTWHGLQNNLQSLIAMEEWSNISDVGENVVESVLEAVEKSLSRSLILPVF